MGMEKIGQAGRPDTNSIDMRHKRKHTEEMLSNSEISYRRVFETAQDGILLLDADTGQITDVNPFLIEMLGYSHNEFLGKKLWEIGLFKHIVENQAGFQKLQSEKYIRYENLPLETKGGQHIDVEFVSNVYSVDHKTVIQCNIRDIPERKHAEEELWKYREHLEKLVKERTTELRIANERLQQEIKEHKGVEEAVQEVREYAESIINTVREPLIALDQDLRVVSVNRSFYEFFKVKPEETVGQLIYDLGNKQWDIPKLRELLETSLPEKATFDNYEVEQDFATIGRRIMLLNARQIQRALGKERIILLAIEDITERRKLEAVHSKLAAIVESADDAIIAEDLEGIIVSWNRGAEIVYGYNAKEIVGKSVSLLMVPSHPDGYIEVLAKIASGETTKHYETQRRRKNGQLIDVSLTISPLKDISGKIIGASIIARDITEKKKLERGMAQARDVAEATSRELEAFSYSVSHDLRAPLRSIDGFSQALLEDYQDRLDDTAKSYLDRVRKATQYMGRLIDDMLKLSRVTRSGLHHASVDMSTMVREISEKLQQNDPVRTVDVIIREGVFVNGDSNLLKIALENLVNNAWKFTSKEARPQFEFGTTVKEGKTACFIRDNGVGFDMTYVNKLFGAFQRLHTSLEFPGTGIGLATVQRIINRHGGQVWAEAEIGKGATFYFTLPG
jgi:PAS domain S-box-containing protein